MEEEPHSRLNIDIAGHHATFDFFHSQLTQAMMSYGMLVNNIPYEHETLLQLITYLRSGDTFIDIGAHIGWFSVWASRFVGATGTVYSIEPEPNNYVHLKRTIADNGCRNVVTYQSAVSEHDGETVFYVNQDNDGGHALWDCSKHEFNEKTRKSPSSILVLSTTLDSFCLSRKIGQIRMIKIDTEGAEVSVLRGASELLSMSAIDYVICEVNDAGLNKMDTSIDKMQSFMADKGYRLAHSDKHNPGFIFNVMFARGGV